MRGFERDNLVVNILLTITFGMIILIIGGMFYVGCQEYRAKRKCADNGGEVVEYNCRTRCHTSDDRLVCNEVCDWKCDGANAEAY